MVLKTDYNHALTKLQFGLLELTISSIICSVVCCALYSLGCWEKQVLTDLKKYLSDGLGKDKLANRG